MSKIDVSLYLLLFTNICVRYSLCSRLTKHLPADSQNISIVGLFGEDEEEEKLAFEAAVRDVNRDSSILRKTSLVSHIEIVDLKNAYAIKQKLCRAMSTDPGITAIFGANSFEGVSLVQSIAETFRIPYFFSVWDASTYPNGTSFNLYPQMETISEAIETIIHDMDWRSFILLYDDDEDFIIFQELLMKHEEYENEENYNPITLKQLPKNDSDLGPLLKEIRNGTETRIVLSCSRHDRVLEILRKMKSLKLMGDYFAYVILSSDAHNINFSEFIPTHTNITIITLIDESSFNEEDPNFDSDGSTNFVVQNVNTYTSRAFLVYDSVYFFAKALDRFLVDNQLEQRVLDCESDTDVFSEGDALVEVVKGTESVGVTGQIRINYKGDRNYHTVQIFQVSPKKRKLGSWNPDTKLEHARNKTQMINDEEEFIANKTFIVSSILGEPYLMKCVNENLETTDEPCVRGFSKDLIQAIASDLKFSFKIVLAPDKQRGSRDPVTGKWNGIIKELQERRADLGICDLTITSERRQVVDFTKPFMSLGISILYRKGKEEETHLFSFLEPLEFQVWLFVATSLLGISIMLFIVSRLSPYDWESSHPCVTETEELENPMSLVNCLWFSLGSVLQQGCDILPKAVSSRIVSAMWWFFTLIMVSTYTANLAAFLTSKQMESDIKDVEALASQSVIKYGCGWGGSTAKFFETSKENLYQKIWATMESSKPSVFTKDNDEGKYRVLRDKQYAFFMESSTIEYIVERHCELTQVGGLLDNKGYGIGMPLNSPYRTQITASLLKQQENGKLKEIKNRWWINNDESKKCKDSHKEDGENALDVSNVGGVFVVLIVGMGIAFTISILEFLWNIRKVAVIEKIPLSVAFWKELHFIINCHISTKPVRKPSEKTSFSNDPPDRYKALMALSNIQTEPKFNHENRR